MAKRVVAAILCLCFISVAFAQSEFEPEHPRLLVYGCETGAGLGAVVGGTAAVAVGSFLVLFPIYIIHMIAINDNGDQGLPEWMGNSLFAAGAVVVPAISGLTVARVGRGFDDVRSTGAGVIGAYCGAVAGIGASYPLWPRSDDGSFALDPGRAWPALAIAAAGTALGATIGYNVSRARPVETGSLGSRVGVPSVALTRVETEDGTAACGADLRLLTVRF